MYERFKRERQKRSRQNGGLFNLQDDADDGGLGGGAFGGGGGSFGGADLLTHGGRSLAASDWGKGDVESFGMDDDDDEDRHNGPGSSGQMDSEYISEMHFGGGLTATGAVPGSEGTAAPRSRKEVLEEMIARSKDQKRERQQSKAKQDDGVAELDSGFGELAELLNFRPQGSAKVPLKDMDAYERDVRSLAFEARSKPSDRLKTAEEVAAEEFEELEELERKRLARMDGTYESEEEDEDDEGGKKGARKKGAAAEDAQKAKAKSAPLSDEMKKAGFKVDPKTGFILAPGPSDSEAEDSEEEEEEGGDDVKGEGESDEEEGDSDSDEDEDDEGADNFSASDEDEELAGASDEDDENEEEEEEADDEEDTKDGTASKAAQKKQGKDNKVRLTTSSSPSPSSMPFVLPCPRDAGALTDLIEQHCATAADVAELLRRVRACAAIALKAENRGKLHNLYDALLRRVVDVGDALGESAPSPSSAVAAQPADPAPRGKATSKATTSAAATAAAAAALAPAALAPASAAAANASTSPDPGQELEVLGRVLYELAHELGGDGVGALWRRYLGELQHRLTRQLRHDAALVATVLAKVEYPGAAAQRLRLQQQQQLAQQQLAQQQQQTPASQAQPLVRRPAPGNSSSSSSSSDASTSSSSSTPPASAREAWARNGTWAKLGGSSTDDDDEAKENSSSNSSSAWLSRGSLALLRIGATVFPCSDLRHGVATPLQLVYGQALAQCPVRSGKDLQSGLLCAAGLLDCAAQAQRVAPEALAFLKSVLLLFVDLKATSATASSTTSATSLDTPGEPKETSSNSSAASSASTGAFSASWPDVGAHSKVLPTFVAAAPLAAWLQGSLRANSSALALTSVNEGGDGEKDNAEDDADDSSPASAPSLPPLSLRAAPQPSSGVLSAVEAAARPGSATAANADVPEEKPTKKSKKGKKNAAAVPEKAASSFLSSSLLLTSVADAASAPETIFAVSCLSAALKLVAQASTALQNSKAFVELFEEIEVLLHTLKLSLEVISSPPDDESSSSSSASGAAMTFVSELRTLVDQVASSIASGMASCRLARQPLRWQTVSKAVTATPSLAPQFEEKLDAEGRRLASSSSLMSAKNENKALAKQLKREQKGASRELRKDAEFLARVRDQERAQSQQARQAERHKNFSWLEEQQATLNLQVGLIPIELDCNSNTCTHSLSQKPKIIQCFMYSRLLSHTKRIVLSSQKTFFHGLDRAYSQCQSKVTAPNSSACFGFSHRAIA